MQEIENTWSSVEEQVAQDALQRAYQRESAALIQAVRDRASQIVDINDLWQLHDFLSARRHEIDGKYDACDSSRLFALAELIRDGWLQLNELEKLDRDKLSKITALTRI